MGQGPCPARPGNVQQQVSKAYGYQRQQSPEKRARRCAQVQRYLAQTEGPQRVLELASAPLLDRGTEPGSHSWITLESSLKDWSQAHPGSVDLLISSFVLEYLEQPRTHLAHVAKALSPTGKARIEVNNLCSYPRDLETEFLNAARMQIFTPHSLATLCSHAGLAPIEIDMGEQITLVCRRAHGHERPQLFPGPCPKVIAQRCRKAADPVPAAPRRSPSKPAFRLESWMN